MKSESEDVTAPSGRVTSEPATGDAAPIMSSRELLDGRRLLQIDHDGERYVLRVTRQGKLILTK